MPTLQWELTHSCVTTVHGLAPRRSDYTATREHVRCCDGIVGYDGATPGAVRWEYEENKSTDFFLRLISERRNIDRRRD